MKQEPSFPRFTSSEEIPEDVQKTKDLLENDQEREEIKEDMKDENAPLKIEPRQLRDRSKIKLPSRYQASFIEFVEPQNYEEALASPESDKWEAAIKEELQAHEKNGTGILKPFQKNATS